MIKEAKNVYIVSPNKANILRKTLAAFVAGVFLFNEISAYALSPESRLSHPEFKADFEAGYTLLANEAVNEYIEKYLISRDTGKKLDLIEDSDIKEFRAGGKRELASLVERWWKNRIVIDGHGRKEVEYMVVSIPGLLKNTGQIGHVGLGRMNDMPVIYMDDGYYYDQAAIEKAIKEGSRAGGANREDAIIHDIEEIRKYEQERHDLQKVLHDVISYDDMRRMLNQHPSVALVFHADSRPLDKLYKEISLDANSIDLAAIYELYRRHGLASNVPVDHPIATADKSSRGGVNIAAGTDEYGGIGTPPGEGRSGSGQHADDYTEESDTSIEEDNIFVTLIEITRHETDQQWFLRSRDRIMSYLSSRDKKTVANVLFRYFAALNEIQQHYCSSAKKCTIAEHQIGSVVFSPRMHKRFEGEIFDAIRGSFPRHWDLRNDEKLAIHIGHLQKSVLATAFSLNADVMAEFLVLMECESDPIDRSRDYLSDLCEIIGTGPLNSVLVRVLYDKGRALPILAYGRLFKIFARDIASYSPYYHEVARMPLRDQLRQIGRDDERTFAAASVIAEFLNRNGVKYDDPYRYGQEPFVFSSQVMNEYIASLERVLETSNDPFALRAVFCLYERMTDVADSRKNAYLTRVCLKAVEGVSDIDMRCRLIGNLILFRLTKREEFKANILKTLTRLISDRRSETYILEILEREYDGNEFVWELLSGGHFYRMMRDLAEIILHPDAYVVKRKARETFIELLHLLNRNWWLIQDEGKGYKDKSALGFDLSANAPDLGKIFSWNDHDFCDKDYYYSELNILKRIIDDRIRIGKLQYMAVEDRDKMFSLMDQLGIGRSGGADSRQDGGVYLGANGLWKLVELSERLPSLISSLLKWLEAGLDKLFYGTTDFKDNYQITTFNALLKSGWGKDELIREIVELRLEAFGEDKDIEAKEKQGIYGNIEMHADKDKIFIAVDGSKIIGSIIAQADTEKISVSNLVVKPEYQSERVGTRLMNSVTEWARARKNRLISVFAVEDKVNGIRPSVGFYDKYFVGNNFKIIRRLKDKIYQPIVQNRILFLVEIPPDPVTLGRAGYGEPTGNIVKNILGPLGRMLVNRWADEDGGLGTPAAPAPLNAVMLNRITNDVLFAKEGERIIFPKEALGQLSDMARLRRELRVELEATCRIENGVVTNVSYPNDAKTIGIVTAGLDSSTIMNTLEYFSYTAAAAALLRNTLSRILSGEEINRAKLGIHFTNLLRQMQRYKTSISCYLPSRHDRVNLSLETIQMMSVGELAEALVNMRYIGTEWITDIDLENDYEITENGISEIDKFASLIKSEIRIHAHPLNYPSPPSAISYQGKELGDICNPGFFDGIMNGLILDTHDGEELFIFFENNRGNKAEYHRMFSKFWHEGRSVIEDLRRIAMKPYQLDAKAGGPTIGPVMLFMAVPSWIKIAREYFLSRFSSQYKALYRSLEKVAKDGIGQYLKLKPADDRMRKKLKSETRLTEGIRDLQDALTALTHELERDDLSQFSAVEAFYQAVDKTTADFSAKVQAGGKARINWCKKNGRVLINKRLSEKRQAQKLTDEESARRTAKERILTDAREAIVEIKELLQAAEYVKDCDGLAEDLDAITAELKRKNILPEFRADVDNLKSEIARRRGEFEVKEITADGTKGDGNDDAGGGEADITIAGSGWKDMTRRGHKLFHSNIAEEMRIVWDLIKVKAGKIGITVEGTPYAPRHHRGDIFHYRIRHVAEEFTRRTGFDKIVLEDPRGGFIEVRIDRDGTLIILNPRFNVNHAGRNEIAVYARDERGVAHEQEELGLWRRHARNPANNIFKENEIGDRRNDYELGLGDRIIEWANSMRKQGRLEEVAGIRRRFHQESCQAEFISAISMVLLSHDKKDIVDRINEKIVKRLPAVEYLMDHSMDLHVIESGPQERDIDLLTVSPAENKLIVSRACLEFHTPQWFEHRILTYARYRMLLSRQENIEDRLAAEFAAENRTMSETSKRSRLGRLSIDGYREIFESDIMDGLKEYGDDATEDWTRKHEWELFKSVKKRIREGLMEKGQQDELDAMSDEVILDIAYNKMALLLETRLREEEDEPIREDDEIDIVIKSESKITSDQTKVLILCDNNVERSPLAAEILRTSAKMPDDLKGRLTFKSAGMLGVPRDPYMKKYTARDPVLASHTQHYLTPDDINEADIIFVMTRLQKEKITNEYSYVKGKIFVLLGRDDLNAGQGDYPSDEDLYLHSAQPYKSLREKIEKNSGRIFDRIRSIIAIQKPGQDVPAVTRDSARNGLSALRRLIGALPEELAGIAGSDENFVRVYSGVTPERQIYVLRNKNMNDASRQALISAIENDSNFKVIGSSLINLDAVTKVIKAHSDYFPPEAATETAVWLENNVGEWNHYSRDRSQPEERKNLIDGRYGFISGFSPNSVRKFLIYSPAMKKLISKLRTSLSGQERKIMTDHIMYNAKNRKEDAALKNAAIKIINEKARDIMTEDELSVCLSRRSSPDTSLGGQIMFDAVDFIWIERLRDVLRDVLTEFNDIPASVKLMAMMAQDKWLRQAPPKNTVIELGAGQLGGLLHKTLGLTDQLLDATRNAEPARGSQKPYEPFGPKNLMPEEEPPAPLPGIDGTVKVTGPVKRPQRGKSSAGKITRSAAGGNQDEESIDLLIRDMEVFMSDAGYPVNPRTNKFLSKEQERKLFEEGTEKSKDILVFSQLLRIVGIAKQYRRGNNAVALMDLVDAGMDAVRGVLTHKDPEKRFDPAKGRLSTYATRVIKWRMKRLTASNRTLPGLDLVPEAGERENRPIPEPSILQKNEIRNLLQHLNDLESEIVQLYFGLDGISLSAEDISALYKGHHSSDSIKTILRKAIGRLSLLKAESQVSLEPLQPSERYHPFSLKTIRMVEDFMGNSDKAAALDPRDQEIIRSIYGLGGHQLLSQMDMRKQLMISHNRISQLYLRAMEKIKRDYEETWESISRAMGITEEAMRNAYDAATARLQFDDSYSPNGNGLLTVRDFTTELSRKVPYLTINITELLIAHYNLRHPASTLEFHGYSTPHAVELKKGAEPTYENVVKFVEIMEGLTSWEDIAEYFSTPVHRITASQVKDDFGKDLAMLAESIRQRKDFPDGLIPLIYDRPVLDRLHAIIDAMEGKTSEEKARRLGVVVNEEVCQQFPDYKAPPKDILRIVFRSIDRKQFISDLNSNRTFLNRFGTPRYPLFQMMDSRTAYVREIANALISERRLTPEDLAKSLGMTSRGLQHRINRINLGRLNYNLLVLRNTIVGFPLDKAEKRYQDQILRVLEDLGGVATITEIRERLLRHYGIPTNHTAVADHIKNICWSDINSERKNKGLFPLEVFRRTAAEPMTTIGIPYGLFNRKFGNYNRGIQSYLKRTLPLLHSSIVLAFTGKADEAYLMDYFKRCAAICIDVAAAAKAGGRELDLDDYFNMKVARALNLTRIPFDPKNGDVFIERFTEELKRVTVDEFPLVKSSYAPWMTTIEKTATRSAEPAAGPVPAKTFIPEFHNYPDPDLAEFGDKTQNAARSTRNETTEEAWEFAGPIDMIKHLLPPAAELIIQLHYFEGKTITETAKALGKREPTIKTLVAKINRHLKDRNYVYVDFSINEKMTSPGFGARLVKTETALGVSPVELGLMLGVNPGTVKNWEMGKGLPQSYNKIVRFAAKTGIPLEYILKGEKEDVAFANIKRQREQTRSAEPVEGPFRNIGANISHYPDKFLGEFPEPDPAEGAADAADETKPIAETYTAAVPMPGSADTFAPKAETVSTVTPTIPTVPIGSEAVSVTTKEGVRPLMQVEADRRGQTPSPLAGSPAEVLMEIRNGVEPGELLRQALGGGVAINAEAAKVLVELGIVEIASSASAEKQPPRNDVETRYCFTGMLRGKTTEETRNLINVVCDVRYLSGERSGEPVLNYTNIDERSLPIQVARELVRMHVLHELNKKLRPAIPQNKILWHIIDTNLIPYDQRTALVTQINKFFRDSNLSERIHIVDGGEDVERAIASIRQDNPDSVFTVGLARKEDVYKYSVLRRSKDVKMLVFEGEAGNFKQLEGIIAVLRTLYLEKSQIMPALFQIYRVLGASPYSGSKSFEELVQLLADNPADFALEVICRLPPAAALPANDLPRLNRHLREFVIYA